MRTKSPLRLNAELNFYEKHKPEWLRTHQQEFVVIKADNLLGFFPSFHSAYSAGVVEYGADTDFLVKRVLPHDPVFVVF